jgi:peroxiredoxin
MLNKILKYLFFALLIIVAGFVVRHYVLNPATQLPATSAEAFFASAFSGLDGQLQPMVQWKGKTIIVNFWATWCPPCLEEMPELSGVHAQYQGQGLVVLGISSDELNKIREFAQQTPVSYPLLSGDLDAMSISESLGNNKGILPYTAIISPDGSIVKTYFGRVNQSLLEETFLPLLGERN